MEQSLDSHLSSQTIDVRTPQYGGANVYWSCSGMRLSLSSANASDNWTFSKLEPMGGRAFNCSLLLEVGSQFNIKVLVTLLKGEPSQPTTLILESEDSLPPAGLKTFILKTGDLPDDNFFSYFEDSSDLFRLMKHALVFTGIIQLGESPHNTYRNYMTS
jgi:hypothetical protein